MKGVKVFPQELPSEIVTFECELSVKALCVLGFFTSCHALGKWLDPEVSHLINEFLLGLICNMIASVKEGTGPPCKKCAMGRVSLELHLPALSPSRSVSLLPFFQDVDSLVLHRFIVLLSGQRWPQDSPMTKDFWNCTEGSRPTLRKETNG